jgi:hypothetical protein
MNVAIFSGLRRPFPPGWTKETVIAHEASDPDRSETCGAYGIRGKNQVAGRLARKGPPPPEWVDPGKTA